MNTTNKIKWTIINTLIQCIKKKGKNIRKYNKCDCCCIDHSQDIQLKQKINEFCWQKKKQVIKWQKIQQMSRYNDNNNKENYWDKWYKKKKKKQTKHKTKCP